MCLCTTCAHWGMVSTSSHLSAQALVTIGSNIVIGSKYCLCNICPNNDAYWWEMIADEIFLAWGVVCCQSTSIKIGARNIDLKFHLWQQLQMLDLSPMQAVSIIHQQIWPHHVGIHLLGSIVWSAPSPVQLQHVRPNQWCYIMMAKLKIVSSNALTSEIGCSPPRVVSVFWGSPLLVPIKIMSAFLGFLKDQQEAAMRCCLHVRVPVSTTTPWLPMRLTVYTPSDGRVPT